VYVRRNVVATQRLLEAVVPVRTRVLFASSSSIYGDAEAYPTAEDTRPRPLSPYGVTKLACEHLIGAYGREFGLDAVVVRYFTIYGPRQRPDMALAKWIARVAAGQSLELHGDGAQSRSFTYVHDAVEATILALERASAGAVLNVGGAEEVSMLEVIETLEEVSGRSVEVVRAPRRQGDQARSLADTSRVRAEIGWEPTTRFADGLAAQWRWAADRVAAR
jgi:UDP-glucuronate 4-epimerase